MKDFHVFLRSDNQLRGSLLALIRVIDKTDNSSTYSNNRDNLMGHLQIAGYGFTSKFLVFDDRTGAAPVCHRVILL